MLVAPMDVPSYPSSIIRPIFAATEQTISTPKAQKKGIFALARLARARHCRSSSLAGRFGRRNRTATTILSTDAVPTVRTRSKR